MIKFLCFLGLLALAQAAGPQGRVRCFQGTVAYSEDRARAYTSINVTSALCEEGQQCGQYSWMNTDDMNQTSFIQTGFCLTGGKLDCSVLEMQPDVGEVSGCNYTICEADDCNTFQTQVCDTGSVIYDTSRSVIILDVDAQMSACSSGETCGLFQFNNTDNNYTSFVESGVCVDPQNPPNCTAVMNDPNVGEVSGCSFEMCQDSNCPGFSKTIPLGRGFICDVGVFVYDAENRSSLIFADNVTRTPCKRWEACGMYSWVNTDADGMRTYIESGFCVEPAFIEYTTCDALQNDSRVGMVSDCMVDFCSGDYCLEFSHLKSPPECPERADTDDVQGLPGCTVKQMLRKSFECFGPIADSMQSMDQENCSAMVDDAIACMSGVIQECIRFENDNMTLCPSVLDAIPGIDMILMGVKQYATQVTSVDSLKMVLGSLLEGSALNDTLNGLDMVCASKEQLNMSLNALRALAQYDLNIGTPVCSDDQIVDDLIEWALEQLESFIGATEHQDICLAFDKLKARMEDAVVHRCYGLNRIGDLLQSQIGSYYSDIVQRTIDIVKYFLLDLELPGCEGFPYPIHLVCNQGTVVYPLQDRTTAIIDESNSTACPPYYSCGMYKWDNTDPSGQKAYVETGFCQSPNYTYSCSDLLQDPNVTEVNNCSVSSCDDGHRCLSFSRDECPEVADDDVAILPRCSLSTTLERGFGCLGSFVGNYPYTQRDECRREVDGVVACVAYTAQSCLDGNCETVLDFIPGLRSFYKMAVMKTRGVTSLSQALRLLNVENDVIEMVYNGICGDEQIASLIESLLNGEIPGLVIDQPICDDRILQDLVRWGLEAGRDIVGADQHQDVCMAFTTLTSRVINAWETRCDVEAAKSFLSNFVPPQLRESLPIAIDVLIDFFRQLRIPNCNQTAGMFDCSRFYEGTSACSMRRAWLCDYVNWKIEFLTSWLRQFSEYTSRNMIPDAIPLIGCLDVDPMDLCMDQSMRRCQNGGDGCRFCFCADHRYKDLTRVMGIYQRDWMRWRRAFERYRRVTQSNQETCMMD